MEQHIICLVPIYISSCVKCLVVPLLKSFICVFTYLVREWGGPEAEEERIFSKIHIQCEPKYGWITQP